MKKFLCNLVLIISLAIAIGGQTTDEYNKGEFFGGYSGATDGDSPGLRGFNGSGVYNFHQYMGVKVDGGAVFRDFNNSSSTWNRNVYNVAAGVQIKNNDPAKVFKPFGHLLVGYGKYSSKSKVNCNGCLTSEYRQQGTSLTIGGGIDFKINRRIDIRMVQLDVIRIYSPNSTWANARFSSGVIVKF
jgi:hypothetical protein